MKNSCFDLVLIVGPDTPNVAELKENYQKLEKEKGFSCLVIGDGVHTVKEADLAPLANRLGSNTRIDIFGHGGAANKVHSIHLLEGIKPTAKIFSKLKTLAGSEPAQGMQVHLWSCFGSAAAKDYDKLPAGAVLMAHASEDKTSLVRMNRESIVEGIMRYQPEKSPDKAVDQALKEYAHYLVVSPETMTVRYGDIKHTVRTPIIPLKMEDTKRLLASQQGEYADMVRESAIGNKALIADIKSLPITDDALAAYAKDACFIHALGGNKKYVSEFLQQSGMHPDKLLDSNDRTALNYVAMKGHSGIVDILAKAGADLNLADKNGITALSMAAEMGHSGVVDILAKAGVNLDSADKYGQTALSKAARNGHSEVVNSFIKAGADINHRDEDGRTALQYASLKGEVGAVKLLVAAGATLETGFWNRSAQTLASNHGHTEIAGILKQAAAERKAQEPTLKKIVEAVKDIPELKSFYKASKTNKELVKSVITSLLTQSPDKQGEVTAHFASSMKTCLERGEKLTAASIEKITDEKNISREAPAHVDASEKLAAAEQKIPVQQRSAPIVPPRPTPPPVPPRPTGSWGEKVQAETQTARNSSPTR